MESITSTDIIGYIGGGILSVQNVPQLVRIMKRKSAKDLSYSMLGLFFIGAGLTIAYGVEIGAVPLFAPLCFSVFVNILITCAKMYYDFCARENATAFCSYQIRG